MNDLVKNLVVWLVLAAILMSVFNSFTPKEVENEIIYSEFVTEVQNERVSSVAINGLIIEGTRRDGSSFRTVRPNVQDPGLMDDLLNHNVQVIGKEPETPSLLSQLLVAAFPILLILAIFVFFMRQMQGGAGGKGGPMSFGKSKAKLLNSDQISTTFADVAGVDEAKEDVSELVDFLSDPTRFQRLGGRIPKGVLMVGPPGTGKTLLAKAIAGEAKVPFFSLSGSEFVEMFVAVGRHRGGGYGGGNDEREQTLNQLLVEMDGFEGNEGVIVIAATNRPDVLDKALLRPGRFDRQVYVSLPDIRGREQILKVHARKVPIDESVELSVIARGTPGFSGADLANLINEAALFSARGKRRVVGMEEFEQARDKIMMGAERRSMVMSVKEKANTAYHEAGHAIIGKLVPEHDPVHKVTIIPRGRALGVTQYLPEEDRYSMSRRQIFSQLCSLFGGRLAEEMIGGMDGVTTGASNDIERATQMARNMVTKWGLSETMGPVLYGEDESQNPGGGNTHYSEDTSRQIDQEVRTILDDAYKQAKKLLEDNRDILEAMKDALMEFETIDADQVDDLMHRRKVRPPQNWDDNDSDSGAGKQSAESTSESEEAPKESSKDSGKEGPIGGPVEEV